MNFDICFLITTAFVLLKLCASAALDSPEAKNVQAHWKDSLRFSSLDDFHKFYSDVQKLKKTNKLKSLSENLQECIKEADIDDLELLFRESTDSVCRPSHAKHYDFVVYRLRDVEFKLDYNRCKLSKFVHAYGMQITSQCLLSLKDHLIQGELTVHHQERNSLYDRVRKLAMDSSAKKIETVPAISKAFSEYSMSKEFGDIWRHDPQMYFRPVMFDVSKEFYARTKTTREMCAAAYPFYSALLSASSLFVTTKACPYEEIIECEHARKGERISRWVRITRLCEVFRRLRPVGSSEVAPMEVPGQMTIPLEPMSSSTIRYAYKQKTGLWGKCFDALTCN